MSLVLIKRVGSNVKPPLPAISTALYCRPQFTGKHSSRTQSEGRRGEGGGVTRRSRRPRRKELRRCTSVLARAISQLSGKVIINIVWHTRGRFGSHSAPAASDIAQMLSVPANPIHAASSQPYSLQLTASPSLQHLGRILHNGSRQ